MIRSGSWWVESKSDPRWNGSGSDIVGGFEIPPAAKEHIEAKKAQFACEPPEDLTFGYMKD
jgi:hypothetical protein